MCSPAAKTHRRDSRARLLLIASVERSESESLARSRLKWVHRDEDRRRRCYISAEIHVATAATKF
jgi:hypothetical protein